MAGVLLLSVSSHPLALLAQSVEQRTFNPLVAGSNPAGGTMVKIEENVIEQVKIIIDQTIDDIKHQKIVSTDQIINVLLDIRFHATLPERSCEEK